MTDDGNPPGAVPEALYGALQASGFPFQTAVEEIVRSTPEWGVAAVEFGWTDDRLGDQFLDIVAQSGTFTAAIECKKTLKDTLTFLLPRAPQHVLVDRARLLYARQIRDSSRRYELFCNTWRVGPASFDSAFCVVSTSASGKDQRMLERDVGGLVRAMDACAQYVVRGLDRRPDDVPGRPFVPVLVTNAPLFVVRYDGSDFSVEAGDFTARPKDVESVRWVRFSKSFGSAKGRDLGERTVFVVEARHLSEFLVELGQTPPAEPNEAGPHLPKIELP